MQSIGLKDFEQCEVPLKRRHVDSSSLSSDENTCCSGQATHHGNHTLSSSSTSTSYFNSSSQMESQIEDLRLKISEVIQLGLECGICRDLLLQSSALSCGHIFCNFCIRMWFMQADTCPMCRSYTDSIISMKVIDMLIEKLLKVITPKMVQERLEIVKDRNLTLEFEEENWMTNQEQYNQEIWGSYLYTNPPVENNDSLQQHIENHNRSNPEFSLTTPNSSMAPLSPNNESLNPTFSSPGMNEVNSTDHLVDSNNTASTGILSSPVSLPLSFNIPSVSVSDSNSTPTTQPTFPLIINFTGSAPFFARPFILSGSVFSSSSPAPNDLSQTHFSTNE